MEKVGTVKETPEDMVELFKDGRRILLRRSEVRKDDTHVIHEIELDDKQAQALVPLLQQSIVEVRTWAKQEQEEQEEEETMRLRQLPRAFSPDREL